MINLSKICGDSRLNWQSCQQTVEQFRQTVGGQIELLAPHIIIAAGTLTELSPGVRGETIVDAYHPGQCGTPGPRVLPQNPGARSGRDRL